MATILVATIVELLPTGGSAVADTMPSALPAQLVQDFHAAFGDHHARAVHAKGIILEGSFQPSADGARLSAAPLFRVGVPVTVRFSDFTGLPDIPDTSNDANPRGFAVKFHLPGGAPYDIVAHSFNGFPAATAAEFSSLLQALARSGPDVGKPTPLDRFFADHPRALAFFTTQKPPPESFATAAYFGVNAFIFTDAAGHSQSVRYRFVPEAGEHYLAPNALKARSATYLIDEIGPRVRAQPIRFTWYAQLSELSDAVDNPSVAWPENRRLVNLGVITIDRLAANVPDTDRGLLFLPGNLPEGIGIADPMVTIRNAAYPLSFHERQ
ncbi:catalase family peroxidase [Roseomonas nepalensis]|uniref:Catalase-related peroxidase n=2 Tax=Muricoccus nepalensis TaxID=1854500 RepID=A0A502F9F2_9PROT|nr:catalase family peroxidase [Roseomonas nepalensis]